MVPAAPRRWQRWDQVADVFAGRSDPDWQRDVERVDHAVTDPWERTR